MENRIILGVKLFCYCNGGYLLHQYTLLKPTECTTQRVSLDANYELQLIMYQYWLISCTRYIKIMQDVNNRETVCDGLYRNSVLSTQLFSKSETSLKKPKVSIKV